MVDINWVVVGIGVLAGGAAGQFIRMAYERWIARPQPVGYRLSIDSVFSSLPHAGALQAEAVVTHDGQPYQFKELSLVRIDMTNSGNRDFDEFAFGVTLGEGHTAVLCVGEGADRLHKISESAPAATPKEPRDTLDFTCVPFNRNDPYTMKLYVRNTGDVKAEHVNLSSAVPIRFSTEHTVNAPNLAQRHPYISIALIIVLSIGTVVGLSRLQRWMRGNEGEVEYETTDGGFVHESYGPDGKILESYTVYKNGIRQYMKQSMDKKLEEMKKARAPAGELKDE